MAESRPTTPDRIGDRYDVHAILGRGGMATVFCVTDTRSSRQIALKQLDLDGDVARNREIAKSFEREFYTLSQLSHPGIVEVYDYGSSDAGPYYTMELVEGGDLRKHSPIPWQKACVMLHRVSSSLALIHSRRLVHRDISPRNIQCTEDGQAKLIDFGAMVPMGRSKLVVGTPPFVAPEVVNLSALDARTDLFSLGATLYYALTGRPPFRAHRFSDLANAWGEAPLPPARIVNDVPAALDDMVLSLMSLDVARRPRSAFEVMQRLAAIAGIESVEPASVSRAYLFTPAVVGREGLLTKLDREMKEALRAERGRCLLIEGAAGLGRSRMLDQCVFEAKRLGATVLRAAAGGVEEENFSLTRLLREQLLAAVPEQGELLCESCSDQEPVTLETQRKLARCLVSVSEGRPLAIMVDDLHRMDDASTGLLATLANEATGRRLLIVATAEASAAHTGDALGVLSKRSRRFELQTLEASETQALFASVFGDVPNLGIVSDGIYRISRGNPRACMDLAQHLVDRRRILYDGGVWSLPSLLEANDLPGTVEEAIRERIDALSPLARRIAEAQALASHPNFTPDDYDLLCPEEGTSRVANAIAELVSAQLLAGHERLYALAHRGWSAALVSNLDEETQRLRHRSLVLVYDGRPGLAVIRHLLAGGLEEMALDRLRALLEAVTGATELWEAFQLDAPDTARVLADALDAAERLRRPPRDVHVLERWLASLSVASDDRHYWRVAPQYQLQLEEDSGLAAWREMSDVEDPDERRMRAVQAAYTNYAATAEDRRVFRPDEAIRLLVQFVAISIAIGARTQDVRLLRSLPMLLEPFAPVSPAVDAIFNNAIATCEARCFAQPERARKRWLDVYDRLVKMTSNEIPALDVILHAIMAGIGAVEATMGLPSANEWAARLDDVPLQEVHALYLRKAVCLQLGDPEGAERFRRKAEVVALASRARQMFTSSLPIELGAHALANDLMGVKHVIDRIEPLAAKAKGWVPYRYLAQARFELIRGDFETAKQLFEKCLELSRPDPAEPFRTLPAFPLAAAGYVETLFGLGRYDEGRTFGKEALDVCRERGIVTTAYGVVRALALVEAKLGAYDEAARRLDELIAEQIELGVRGLNLAASHEARARVAIWSGDGTAVETHARLSADEYGAGSPTGAARYDLLVEEARRGGTSVISRESSSEHSPTLDDARTILSLTCKDAAEVRCSRVLELLCNEYDTDEGYLYLVRPDGLSLAAAYGAAQSLDSASLLELAGAHIAQSLGGAQTETMGIGDTALIRTNTLTVATDTLGRKYGGLLLTCFVDGSLRHAGVALMHRANPALPPPVSSLLASEVAAHLIRVGDTMGLCPTD